MTRALRPRVLLALAGAGAVLATTVLASTSAAAGAQSSISVPSKPGKTSVSWTGTVPFGNGQAGLVYGQLGIDDPTGACEPSHPQLNAQRTVKVTFPKGLSGKYDTLVRFSVRWKDTVGDNTTNDLAMHLFGPDGKLVASSDGSQSSEGINVTDRRAGTYRVLVCAFQNFPQGTPYTGSVTAYTVVPAAFPRAKRVVAPTYRQFAAPKGVADSAGEPSIGSNWKSGNTLYTSNTDEYVVTFDDKRKTSRWTLVNDDVTDPSNKISLDPIGFTDHVTGRTFVSQLYLACSAAAYSDDDFATRAIPSEGCGTGINGADHQTFGGGPFPENLRPLLDYPHAVYYCSQGQGLLLGGATCARSDNGGLTFNPPVATWTTQCSGIHGHVQVAPNDGTVYLPNAECGDRQGVAVSQDGGRTWAIRTIPDSISGESDPYVGIGKDGTVYYSYSDGTGHARVAISRDRGKHWSRSIDVGVPFGIRNSEFAMTVAGDGDRAAVAFLGTKTPGSTQAASFGKSKAGDVFVGGAWHMYVATTYDRGRTWTTVDATPKDPVQRGCIWNSGGSNPCRNLLDFNGMTIDKTGRVMIGFADGCVGPSVDPKSDCVDSADVRANKLVNHGAIVRQMTGRTLFRAYDAKNGASGSRAGSSAVAPRAPSTVLPRVSAPQQQGAGAAGSAKVDATRTSSSHGLNGAATLAVLLVVLAAGWFGISRRLHAARR
ncbi:MAG TPA: sialidase family protein [Mycobacteriales bacterium]|nr:sialidase family protein [Mycobacteriales bacterium]